MALFTLQSRFVLITLDSVDNLAVQIDREWCWMWVDVCISRLRGCVFGDVQFQPMTFSLRSIV